MSEVRSTYQRIRVFAELRRSWWILVLCVLVGGCGAYAIAHSQPKEYTAQSQILVRSAPSVGPLVGSASNQVSSPLFSSSTTIQNTVQLVTAAPMQQLVRDELTHRGRLQQRSSLADIHAVTVQGGTASNAVSGATQASAILTITATSRNPQDAAAIATEFANKFVIYRRGLDEAAINSVASRTNTELQQQLKAKHPDNSTVADLRSQALSLAVAAGLQTGNVYVLQTAGAPHTPSSPRPIRSAALGAALGLVLGIAILLLRAYLDRRVKTVEDVESILGVPCIGTVSLVGELRGARLPLSSPLLEPFRMSVASLRYLVPQRPVRSIAVASAVSNEGKTTIAHWLAVSGASIEHAVLIDADLRKHTLSRLMRAEAAPGANGHHAGVPNPKGGLTDVILQTVSANTALTELDLSPVEEDDERTPAGRNGVDNPSEHHGSGSAVAADRPIRATKGARSESQVSEAPRDPPRLSFLESGTPLPNPLAVFAQGGFEAAISAVSEKGGTIYIDTPALRLTADALEIVQRVDAVVLVARLGATTINDLVHLRKLIDEHKLPAVGVIVNNVAVDRSYGGYGYRYGYYEYGADETRSRFSRRRRNRQTTSEKKVGSNGFEPIAASLAAQVPAGVESSGGEVSTGSPVAASVAAQVPAGVESSGGEVSTGSPVAASVAAQVPAGVESSGGEVSTGSPVAASLAAQVPAGVKSRGGRASTKSRFLRKLREISNSEKLNSYRAKATTTSEAAQAPAGAESSRSETNVKSQTPESG